MHSLESKSAASRSASASGIGPPDGAGKNRVCFVCGGALALFGPYSRYTYYCCGQCGTLQLWPLPDEQEMVRAYEAEYVSAAQTEEFTDPDVWREVSRTYCASMVKVIEDYRITGPIVDYGAGWGLLVELLNKRGFQARGLEISRQELAYAQARGLPIEKGDLQGLQGVDAQLSAITLLAVFEHLVNHGAVLRAAHRLLKPGGLFVTLHPTASIYRLIGNIVRLGDKRKPLPDLLGSFTAPWHTALFSVAATEQLISRYGFRLLEIRPAPQGRFGGMVGLVQRALELVNKLGWALLGTRWPLVTTHIFVFEKAANSVDA
jgi:SAM-dependent methyltransferase